MVAKRTPRASSVAVHAGRPDSARQERTGSMVSTESDEATPRNERYGGGGTNSV